MKVTDGTESPHEKVYKLPESSSPGELKTSSGEECVPTKDATMNNGIGTDGSSSSGGEDHESSVNGSSSAPSPVEELTNGQSSSLENGTSDKENFKPARNTSSKKRKSANKNSRNSSTPENTTATNSSDSKSDLPNAESAKKSVENGEVEKSENEDGSKDGKTESSDDVFYVHDAGLTIKIMAPGAETFEIQVHLFILSPGSGSIPSIQCLAFHFPFTDNALCIQHTYFSQYVHYLIGIKQRDSSGIASATNGTRRHVPPHMFFSTTRGKYTGQFRRAQKHTGTKRRVNYSGTRRID